MFKNLGTCLLRLCSLAVLAVGCVALTGAAASASDPHYRYNANYHRPSPSPSSHWGTYSKSSNYYSTKKTPACGSYYGSHKSTSSPYHSNSTYHPKQKYSRGY